MVMQILGRSKISTDDEVTIPKEVRDLLGGVREGDNICYYKVGDQIAIKVQIERLIE